ncbi:MAG: hypothetical protein M3Z20_18130 [Chloroflexota bacterium]|nr:hypothetical protein [Chloroflexota bacterium]
MDANRFDILTRKVGAGQTRRQALAALAAVPALWMQRGRAAQLGPPPCGGAGKPCTMLAGCCDGLTCVTSAINTNYGVCVSGGDGGTIASGTSLVSPYSESAQSSGTVDAPTADTTTTTTTGTTTTSTTDPKAERQAKLQERRSRRSTRRNKIQSRRTTKSTSRKTRREDAREAEVLAAGPELDFDFFTKSMMVEGAPTPYEELRVSNLSDFSAQLSSVKVLGDSSDGQWLGEAMASGSTLGLVSGPIDEKQLVSDQQFWSHTYVCLDPSTAEVRGWIVKAAFSGEVENRTYTILCDGSVNGVPLTPDVEPTNNRKKRKKKQQAAARRKKRKQNNKKDR